MRSMCLVLLLASAAFAQADFELQVPACGTTPPGVMFPTPCGAGGDPEGISWNGTSPVLASYGVPTTDIVNPLGMPCSGTQFLRNKAASSPLINIPVGGPIPTPAGQAYSDVYIPIPPGANTTTFCWDFYSAEGDSVTAGTFNDAMSIDVVGACGGPSLANLVYADTGTATALTGDTLPPCGVSPYPLSGETEVPPVGAPQTVVNAILPAGSAFLRIRAANSADNDFPSHAVIDGVTFTFGAIPCALVLSAPCMGSLKIDNTPCAASAGRDYLIGVTGVAGNYPNGWYFGVDIALAELVNQYNFGFPFRGTLDASGASTFGPIPCFFLPSGAQLWAATGEWQTGFGLPLGSRPPTTFVIP